MPTIFQTKDKKTGKPHRNWRFKFIDFTGKRKTKTGLPSKVDTEKLAWKIQAEHDEIRKGLRPPPKESETKRMFADVIAEYLAWGNSQGGHGGLPWSQPHSNARRRNLKFWQKKLGIHFLHELAGSLPRVEEVLREKQNAGRKGKTLQNLGEALAALCDWAVKREYLDSDPLKNLQKFDVTPTSLRRAPTIEEIRAILAIAQPELRLLYLVAIASGLRKGELRCLRVKHLDAEHNGFTLEKGWTKGRKATFQPLHPVIVQELAASSLNKAPNDPLLSVPEETAQALYRELEKVNIPKLTDEGRLDFHALRTGYITLVLEADANVKEAQTLARHSTPNLTLNVYAKTRSERLSGIAGKVGDFVLGPAGCPTAVQPSEPEDNLNSAKPLESIGCSTAADQNGTGSNPVMAGNGALLEAGLQVPNGGLKPAQVGQLQGVTADGNCEHRTLEVVAGNNAGRAECTTVVQRIVDRLPQLSSASRSALLALANKTEAELLMRAFNSAFEIRREVLPAKNTSIAKRWYIETLRAQGMSKAG